MRVARACWAGVGDTSSILAAGFPHLAHLIKYKCCMSNADVAAYIGRWRPSSVSAQAAAFGLDPVPEVLLHPSVTERFTRAAPGLSGVARRTLRTNLRFIGRRVVPQFYPADVPLPRERAKTPYSPAEIAGYLALADAQPTAARRMRAAGLVALGAGAGLIRGDLREVRGSDVAGRSGGVVVTVRGARPRTVPVLARYQGPLLAAARRPDRRAGACRRSRGGTAARGGPAMIALAVLEDIIDASGAAPRIEAMLPIGVRPRQLTVRALLAGMCLTQADHRPAHLTRVHQALTSLPGG